MTRMITALLAIAAVAATTAAPASGQVGAGAPTAERIERLTTKVDRLERRLARTRRGLRRRLARVERALGQGGETPTARRLTSPDGRFAIDLTNDGLFLRSPGARVGVGASTLTLSSGSSTTLQLTPAELALRSSIGTLGFNAQTRVLSPLIRLGGGTGCPPVARRTDAVQLAGEGLLGTITGGSPGVLAC